MRRACLFLPLLITPILILLLALALGLSACTGTSSDDTVAGGAAAGGAAPESSVPTDQSEQATTSSDTLAAEVDPLEWPMAGPTVIDVPSEEVASAIISAQGGVIEYGPIKLEIPAGALGADTTISITRLSASFHDEPGEGGGSESVSVLPVSSVYDFGPAGTRFDKPVTMTLPYDPGMGPGGADPQNIGIAYFDGERWAIAGGTADPATRTVSVQVKAFEGLSVRAVLSATGPFGLALGTAVEYIRGPDSTVSDPVLDGNAKDWVTPNDPVVKEQAAKMVIQDLHSKQIMALDDPGVAAWLDNMAKTKDSRPAFVYQNPDGTVTMGAYNDKDGSNWQTPAHYFGTGTAADGPVSGDCTDGTNAVVSVLKVRGISAKGVYGHKNGGDPKAPCHAWAEVVVGGKVYRVEDHYLYTPEKDKWHYDEYKHITDPADPYYQSMWDDAGQAPYDPDWWGIAQFAGTYKGVYTDPNWGDIPWELSVDAKGNAHGRCDWSGAGKGNKLTVEVHWSFTGQVSKDGKLSGEGTAEASVTNLGQTNTVSRASTIVGSISDGAFTGTNTADATVALTAKRQ